MGKRPSAERSPRNLKFKILLDKIMQNIRFIFLRTFQNIAYFLGLKTQFGHFWREREGGVREGEGEEEKGCMSFFRKKHIHLTADIRFFDHF